MSILSWHRVFALQLSLVAGALSILFDVSGRAESHRLTLEVLEPIGAHRDGSPVHALLVLPRPTAASTSFRLLQDSRPVVAQFRPDSNAAETSKWWLDFIAQSAPNESQMMQNPLIVRQLER